MAVTRIQLRRDVAADWTAANPILADGEMGVEKDSRLVKIGDGTSPWNSLPYVNDTKLPERLSEAALSATIVTEGTKTFAAKSALRGDGGELAAREYVARAVELAPRAKWLDTTATNAPDHLDTPVPYIGDETVHPSVRYFPKGIGGYNWWMAMTPYENSDVRHENPSVYASLDGIEWFTPEGATNPVIPDPGSPKYNSDCTLVDGEDGWMYMFWRQVNWTLDGVDATLMVKTEDGVNWTAPVATHTAGNEDCLSPAIIKAGSKWRMYFINFFTSLISYKEVDRLGDVWGPITALTQGTGPEAGRKWWHLEAINFGGTHVLVANDMADPGPVGEQGNLWLLWSGTGAAGSFAKKKFLDRRVGQWDEHIYRATLQPVFTATGVEFMLYYSAFSTLTGWKVGRTTMALPLTPLDEVVPPAPAVDAGNRLMQGMLGYGFSINRDDFTRADNAASLGSTLNGTEWVTTSGALGILGNRAYAPAAGNNKAMIDLARTDGRLIIQPSASGGQFFLVLRYVDESNFWRIGYQGGAFRVDRVTGGNVTTLHSSTAPTNSASALIEAVYDLNGMTVFLDGVERAKITATDHNAGTRVGMQLNEVATRIRYLTALRK